METSVMEKLKVKLIEATEKIYKILICKKEKLLLNVLNETSDCIIRIIFNSSRLTVFLSSKNNVRFFQSALT